MDLEPCSARPSELLTSLERYRFPDVWLVRRGENRAVCLSFEAALVHRLGLDGLRPGFAARLVTEYRRYLMLVSLSADVVLPSPGVVAVGQLHRHATGAPALPGVLVRAVRQQAARCAAGDARFVDLYRATFGIAPPGDIWPGTAERRARRIGAGTMGLSTAVLCLVLLAPEMSASLDGGHVLLDFLRGIALPAALAGLFIGCSLLTEGAHRRWRTGLPRSACPVSVLVHSGSWREATRPLATPQAWLLWQSPSALTWINAPTSPSVQDD